MQEGLLYFDEWALADITVTREEQYEFPYILCSFKCLSN